MTDFYKQIDNGYIIGIGTNGNDCVDGIGVDEYNNLLSILRSAPVADEGYAYVLRADTLTWELVEVPFEEE